VAIHSVVAATAAAFVLDDADRALEAAVAAELSDGADGAAGAARWPTDVPRGSA